MAVHNESIMPKLGVRSTRQRAAVVNVLRELDNFASAKEIHQALTERKHKVGLTTVYRTLQSLADIDAVDVLHMASGESLYRQCTSDEHHHHLVCTGCGTTVEIDGGPVERWAHSVADENDFQLTGHTAEVFGLCAQCQHSPI
ncbi:transcriptional repressor [Corynebacterium canis]|uniref:Transcriptional repressor n=1 Tax=Corynebacterium canis TaxID=679663 RepID=A0A5C5US00_9CORY|nr:Fur family transcriptional regulator [Corynebacterium canis]TWT28539.1 transcriptional repressor [Corynebacterium canis]WJY75872.1 Zinc uptake regulation protein [Corynebacterium canis]